MRTGNCKKSIIQVIAIVNVLCLIVSVLTGCGEADNTVGNYRNVSGAAMESGSITSNSDYELLWDKDAGAVLLKSVKDGKIWSDIIYEAYLEGSVSANGNSPICITVADTQTLKWDTVSSYSEIPENGKILCKKIDNGIRVTYFFDRYKIAVPIEYQLREDSLGISVNTSQILEDGVDYKLVSVSLVPYLCSVANSAENGHMLVPSGSGALMYTAENAEGTRNYTGEVYGADAARQVPESFTDDEPVRLPVFGAAGDGSAMLGIIEDGAGAAVIEAQAGNDRLGYSNVGVNFYVRGYDEFHYESHGTGNGITTRIRNEISGQTLSVGYYPLLETEADYNGMAKKYREYLIEKGMLQKDDSKASVYGVTLFGGTNITTSILGLPKQKTVSLTTFEQAYTILSELRDKNGIMPTVRLSAFGDNGLRAGTVAGGERYPSIYGTKKELSALQKLCDEENTLLFTDAEIVYFSKSGDGFSLKSDTAETAINKRISHYPFTPIRIMDESAPYSVLSRSKLFDAAELAADKAEHYGNKAIGFSSLGSIAFSDYSDEKYATKNGIEEDVASILNSVKSSGYKTSVAGANSYAACAADVLFDVATDNGGYIALDEQIPFYQMVFHSYKPMFSEAVNLHKNSKQAVAQAVACGIGLGFTLTHDYVDESDDLDEYKLYGAVYEDNITLINESLVKNKYIGLYYSVADAVIDSYELLSDGVSKTVYSNGITVYVNHTADSVNCPVGTLGAFEFITE